MLNWEKENCIQMPYITLVLYIIYNNVNKDTSLCFSEVLSIDVKICIIVLF